MYIAFDLIAADLQVNDNRSQAAWVNHILHQELSIWYQKHGIAYSIKTVKYVTRVVLEPDEMYSFFCPDLESSESRTQKLQDDRANET